MSDSATDSLVIGYGNPLRRDDGVGWAVVEAMSEHVESIATHQLVPELAAQVARVGRVVFVDAEVGSPSGKVRVVDLVPSSRECATMAHHLGPRELLALAIREFGRAPPAQLVTIVGEDFGYGKRLSPRVLAACDRVVARLTKELADNEKPCTSSR